MKLQVKILLALVLALALQGVRGEERILVKHVPVAVVGQPFRIRFFFYFPFLSLLLPLFSSSFR